MKQKFKALKFPQDELAHPYSGEWWYFNGHLKDKKRNRYAYMNCLFIVDVKKSGIPILAKMPFKTFSFSHSIFSDIGRKKFYPAIHYYSKLAKDSFSKPLLYISYINPTIFGQSANNLIEEKRKFEYRLINEWLDLRMVSIKKPLLVGDRGFLDFGTKQSYYYSLTNLQTTGFVNIGHQKIEVSGKSWMDHQWWKSTVYSDDKWSWFSLQLDNNVEILCVQYQNSKIVIYFAGISWPDGSQEHTDKVKITPFGRKWRSPKTQASYPVSWKIELPEKKISLVVTAYLQNQEITFGTINYWEGPLAVRGRCGNKEVSGLGFSEQVGRPSKYNSLRFAEDEIKEALNKISSVAKQKVLGAIGKK